MVIRGILLSLVWLLLIPICVGVLFERQEERHSLLLEWIYGMISMMALAQVILIPLIALRKSFSLAMGIWLIGVLLLTIAGVSAHVKKEEKHTYSCVFENRKEKVLVLCVAAVVLVQCLMAGFLQHSDADDARFVAESVIAVEQDSMYVISPISGEPMYKVDYLGDVRKDLTSPWVMYIAMLSKLCAVAPAFLAHALLPFYLVLFCYAVYTAFGYSFFNGNKKNTAIFIVFLSVFMVFDYTSTHTVGTVMLFRIWQGKAFAAAGIVPLLFYLYLQYTKNRENKSKRHVILILLWIASFAASLVSGIGILLELLLVAILGLTEWIMSRKVKSAIMFWLTGLPSLFYLICQYKYWEIFVAPWFI